MEHYYMTAIIPHTASCVKELYNHRILTSKDEWMYMTNEIIYYSYPIILLFSFIFSLLNSIVTAKMVTDSHECYLTGFNVASFILVVISIVIQVPNYVSIDEPAYTSMLAYLPSIENWCWYCCTWLLLTAVAERLGHAICGRWHASFGRVHGILASLLIVVVCFVSTLPQYWEYEAGTSIQVFNGYNCSRLLITPRDSILEEEGGYVAEYYYYNWIVMIFSVAVPYLVLPIMLPAVCCVKMHSYTALSTNGTISTYADDYSSKDCVKDERSFNRMLCVVAMFYLFMSGPRNAIKLLHNPPFFMNICDFQLKFDTLVILFDMAFYLMFVFLFFFYLCMSPKFRKALYSLKSKCCCRGRVSDD